MNAHERSLKIARKILLFVAVPRLLCRAAWASMLAVAFALAATGSARAQAPPDKFQAAIARAAEVSTLATPGGSPFHLKLTTSDTTMHKPEYAGEIEIWWAAPDRWRREVRFPTFTQIAVQDGAAYFESNGADDYLPYWLYLLTKSSIDPIPVAALANVTADDDQPGCGKWETEYGAGAEKFSSYNSVCFNYDGTANKIFAPLVGLELGDYQPFGGRMIARRLKVSGAERSEVTGTITLLEPLPEKLPSNVAYADGHFAVPKDTGFNSRLRVVAVSESELAPASTAGNAPPTFPPSFVFPMTGAIAVTVEIDRGGSVRGYPRGISKNQGLNAPAIAQIKDWKFKPYLVDGAPVEVVTTLIVPFHLKYEPLGANGKSFPEISFREHIIQSRELSDPRTPGAAPFKLHAAFVLPDKRAGEYLEGWGNPATWMRSAHMAGVSLTELEENGQVRRAQTQGDAVPPELEIVLKAMRDHFPDLRTFQEADWGNSAVALSNIDPLHPTEPGLPELIRAARGGVNANNQPVSGQAYWFDSTGLLRADFVDSMMTVYSDFATWNAKQIPRRIEVFKNGTLLVRISVDAIDAQ